MNVPSASPASVAEGEELSLHDLVHSGAVVGAIRDGAQRAWTGREVKILRERYGQDGLRGCLGLLPGRTAGAIYQKAGLLKVRSAAARAHPREQRWFSSEQIDATIRRLYPATCAKDGVARLARQVGRPRWWVSRRAVKLGVVPQRRKEPPWSAAEITLLRERAHQDPTALQRVFLRHGFRRTPTAISVRLKREGFDRTDPDRMNARQLAACFGVDPTTICHWIAKGWLMATRRGGGALAGESFVIHRRDIARFVVDAVAAVDLRKVDKIWFVDLLAEYGGGNLGGGDETAFATLGMTPAERGLMSTLMSGHVVSRERLHRALYAGRDTASEGAPTIKIIDVLLCKLRVKVKPLGLTIETIRGQGYLMPAASRDRLLELIERRP